MESLSDFGLSTVFGGEGGMLVYVGDIPRLENLYRSTFTLCMGPNSDSTKLLGHPKTKT